MGHSVNFFCLCAIVSHSAISVTQNFATGAGESESVSRLYSENLSKTGEGVRNIASYHSNRTRKKCETPNGRPGYCVGIRSCPTLLKQVENKHAWEFLRACRCSRSTKTVSNNPKVCCEIDGNFRRMHKKCETPNGRPGYCIGIKSCPTLLKQVGNKHAWEFLRASSCTPTKTTSNNPKVCCEIEDNRNISKNIGHDEVLPKTCGRQKMFIGNRIVGGREASLQEYPWMALLLHKNFYDITTLGCAAFLIHTKYVLTAAHCTHPDSIRQKGPIVSVLLGKHNIQTSTDCSSYGFGCGENTQIHETAKITTHPQYDPTDIAHYNDIAIIQLKDNARLTDYVQPICLATDDSQSPFSYHVSGWGKTESGKKSKIKMQVTIPSFDKGTCAQLYSMVDTRIILRDTQICAGGEELSDTCSGDSGGPLMMMDDDGTWYASGIVSFGVGCGVKGWPGVYTNIVKFLPWIKSIIAQGQR